MNSLETSAGAAIEAVLATDAVLLASNIAVSDTDAETMIPRVVIKCQQGEELVYRCGVYRIACTVLCATHAQGNPVDDLKARVVRLLLDNQDPGIPVPIQVQLTTAAFHCFALEPGSASKGNVGDKRTQTTSFSLVGFDLTRYQ